MSAFVSFTGFHPLLRRAAWPLTSILVLALACGTASAASSLRLFTQRGYLPSNPVLVRVEVLGVGGLRDTDLWNADALLSADAGVTLSTNRIPLRNGLGSGLVMCSGGGNFTLTVTVGSLTTNKALVTLAGSGVTRVSGTLPGGATTWSGIVAVTNDLTVPAGHTLTILSNTLVLLNGAASGTGGADVTVLGRINALGTEDQPVTFTCTNAAQNWGEIRHTNSALSAALLSTYRNTLFTKAGRSPAVGHTGTGPMFRLFNSSNVFDNCVLSDNAGKIMYASGSDLVFSNTQLARSIMGPEIAGSALLFRYSHITDMFGSPSAPEGTNDNDGIYLHGQQGGQVITLRDSVLSGGHDDAIDTLGSSITVSNCIVRDWPNPNEDAKGISGFNGTLNIRRCLFANCFVGVAMKTDAGVAGRVNISESTVTGVTKGMSAAVKANAPGPIIDFRVTNCIVRAPDAIHTDFGPTNFTIGYSALSEPWTGTGNITANSLLADEPAFNFHLWTGSPCIDAGDPAGPADPDASRNDMGYFPYDAGAATGLFVALTAPNPGDVFTAPTNISLTASAQSTTGTLSKVEFYQGATKLGEDASSPYTLTWNNPSPGLYTLTAVAFDSTGVTKTSAPAAVTVNQGSGATTNALITFGAVWKYLDNGSDQGTAWKEAAFDDSTWTNGPAQLGYGDNPADEATIINGGPAGARFATTYFRRAFNATGTASVTNLAMRLLRDDAGAVYLNGTEVFRTTGLAAGAAYNTYSSANGENTIDIASFTPVGLLVEGANVVAVEIHQQTPNSSDVSFDFELLAIAEPSTNNRPLVAITAPAGGTLFGTPANFTITAAASDSDGSVTNVAFYDNGSKLGDDALAPYSYDVVALSVGAHGLTAVATDNVGASTTSAVVNVTVSTNIAPPIVFNKVPASGNVTTLTGIVVTFSKDVIGVNAGDLLVNGVAASTISGSGSNYTFGFTQPAYGAVAITWASGHGIIDLFTPSHAFATNTTGANWTYTLLDAAPPVMAAINPVPSATVASLTNIAVTFSEVVTGVNAADLRVNGVAPTTLAGSGAGPYTFGFAQPPPGAVTVNWVAGHGIIDTAANAFAGGTWSYSLDTNATGIVISEIMYHPSNESTNEEWIEIHNRGAAGVNLAGWRLSAGVQFTFPSVSIAGGGYLVVCADTNAFSARYPGVSNIVGNWSGFLNNSGEDIDLDNASGNRVDSVRYADEGDWAVRQRGPDLLGQRGWVWFKPHDGFGKTLELMSAAMPNGSGQNWAASGPTNGTPGAANSVVSANVPPLILDVTHFPVVPRSTDSPLITARVLDEAAGSLTVTLHHRVSAAIPPAFSTATMRDDSTSGDAAAGDGIFTVQLAPQANNAVIEFYVRAVDFHGNARTWPGPAIAATDGTGPTGQVANALFQIDDTSAPTNNQPLYKMIFTVAENSQLASIPSSSPNSDAQMNGTFLALDADGSAVRYLVGVRNRGHGSRSANPPNYRVNFRSDDRWQDVSGLNINSVNTYIQHMGAVAARKAGADGSSTIAVRLRVNNADRAIAGSPMFGSYAAVEALDGDWASHHYPLDGNGNVYRVIRDISPPDFSYRGETPSSYQNTWFKESNVSENDWSDLIAMLRVVGINNSTPFTSENVRQVINVEQWLRHLAVMNLLGNAESGLNTGYNDDYYKYRGVSDPRFILMYHDLDSVLGVSSLAANSSIFTATANNGSGQAMDRLLNWPDFQPLYYQTLLDIVNGVYSQANFDALVDQTLGGYVDSGSRASVKSWMASRRASVLAQIPAFTVSNAPVAVVTGAPRSPTPFGTAALTVGGSNVVSYRFSLNGGAYGVETAVGTPISLSGLANGSNSVAVIGKNALDLWQGESNATVLTWVVNTALPTVRLNEVLARNDSAVNHSGTFPDLIELFNEAGSTVSLAGMRLTDDPANPNKFTFPPGTTLASGAYLVVFANNPDATPGFHTGFTLDAEGEGVYLFDSVASGGALLDSVVFGIQLPNLAIGRVGGSGDWLLTTPTSGAANTVRALGSQTSLKINEWLASGLNPYPDDFIELYNAETNPVALGGLFLTDRPIGSPALSRIAPLSFIAGSGYTVFTADGGNGNTHVNFRLAAEQGEIGLVRERYGASGAAALPPHLSGGYELIDCVIYGPQRTDVASGRCPDGSPTIREMVSATPGVPNACPFTPPAPQTIVFVNYTNEWRYDQTGADFGTAWRGTNYDDSGWPQGPALLGFETTTLAEPLRTQFTLSTTKTTFYFRIHFNVPVGTTISGLQVTEFVDDGLVYYLNGEECRRLNMPAGPISATMLANATVGDATPGGPFSLPMTNLYAGDNVLAVEVHQSSTGSSDLVFGCKLEGVIATNSPAAAGVLINEILANNATLEEPDGSKPDWVEIYNPSTNAVDLAGMSLTDDLGLPQRWVFPAGSLLTAQGYFRVRLDPDLIASATNAGFGLKANGGAVHLINRPADGGSVANAVAYGLQAADFSIGRVPDGSANIVLTTPSFGSANLAASLGDAAQLKVNEWMAWPDGGEDWFEIYNPNAQPVNISRFYLSDDVVDRTKAQLPALSFIGTGPYGFMKFDADNSSSPPDHVPFRLNNDGEAVAISATNGAMIHQITFGPQTEGVSQGLLTDGTANIVPFPTTATPGKPNFLPLAELAVNEVLTHSDPPLEDAVEIFNLTGDDVNIGGWYLSDSQNNLLKYRIPSNSIVPANGFAVFYEVQFNFDNPDVPFSFSSARGDEIYLSQSSAPGVLTGYRAFAEFGASENGVSFGRFRTSAGVDFTAMSARTFGQDNPATTNQFRTGTGLTNAYPKVGPIVISEIMYNFPGDTNDLLEFVELHNILGSPVPLYDPANPLNAWRVRKGIDFNFPTGVVMQAGGFVVLVNFDPATNAPALANFQAVYGTNMTLFGPYSGKLANAGEAVELQKPDAPQTTPGPEFGFVPRIAADRVVYSNMAPWPAGADGTSNSLKKLTASLYGNEPLNWDAGTPTPGAANSVSSGTNAPPILAAIGNKSVFEGAPLSFTATANDTNTPAQTLTFSLDGGAPGGASITPGGAFTWVPTEAQGPGTYPITIRVTDNGSPSFSDSETITVTVNETNAAPALTPIGDKTVNEGQTVTFTADAADSDVPVQTLMFSLDAGAPAAASIDPGSGAFSWATTEADGPGSYNVTVRVTDNGTPARSSFETITITVNEVNMPPSLAEISDRTVSEGATISFSASATDADLPAQTLTYSLGPGAPAGASITSGGAFSWTTTEANGPGTNTLRVIVADNGAPSLSATQSFTVIVNEVNLAPTFAAIADRTVNEGVLLTFTNVASDADLPANTLTFSLDAGTPAGASVNSSNGVFTWTPSEAQGPGSNYIRVIVTDNGTPSLSVTQGFSIVVSEVNVVPVVSAISNTNLAEGNTLSFNASATDADVPANSLTFSLDAGAPAGASITAGGAFTWTPTEAQGPGSYPIKVIVSDNGAPSLTATQSFTVTVTELNTAPTLAGITDRTINEGMTLSITNATSDADLPAQTLTFSLGAGAPSGASIGASSGILTWTPTEAQGPGSYPIRVIVTDNGPPSLTATQGFNVAVSEVNQPPVLAAIGNKLGTNGTAITFTASATDPDSPANTLTYSLAPGAPAGASIDPNTGAFSWTPTLSQAGAHTLTVRVADDGVPVLEDFEMFNIAVTLAPLKVELVSMTNKWRYDQSASNLFTAWRSNSYNDASWPLSNGVFYNETNVVPAPLNTFLALSNGTRKITNYYFRTRFWLAAATNGVVLTASNVLDDGSVIYLNGAEAARINMNAGAVTVTTLAASSWEATNVYATNVVATNLSTGDNLLAVEVHQQSATSSDVVFGLALSAMMPGQAPVSITQQPTNLFVPSGQPALFSVTAIGGAPQFQWFRNGVLIPGANAATYSIAAATTNDSATYSVVVSNYVSMVTSSNALLSVDPPPNTPPTISAIADQSINEDGVSGPLAFTIDDAETPADSLTLSVASTNTTLVPVANIVFGGSGTSRTITVTPVANRSGTTRVTVSVSDGQFTVQEVFLVTVAAVNDVPTITAIADQSIAEDGATAPLEFTIDDVETAPGSLNLNASSTNTALVPVANITFAGTAENRTVTVTPAPNAFGTTLITVRVDDGAATNSRSFLVTVAPVNDTPEISAIADQVINEDTPTAALAFTVGDVETAAASLTVTRDSTNTALVPVANIVLGGSGANRTVTVTPATNRFGTTLITLTVSDGTTNASASFLVTVSPQNDPPSITPIADQTIDEDGTTAALIFTIGDVESAVGSLAVTRSSTNTALVSDANVVLGGSGSNRTVTVAPVANAFGTTLVTLTVSDGSASTQESFLITVNPVNDAPTLAPLASQTIAEGSTLTVSNSASDIDLPAQVLTFALGAGAPAGASIDANTGVFTWTPSEAQGSSSNSIEIIVSDNGSPSLSATQLLGVLVTEVNSSPMVAPIADRTIGEGMTLIFTNTATDADLPANAITWSLDAGAPSGAVIFPSTGVFIWTPTEAQAPLTAVIRVIATDNGTPSLSATQSFTVTVTEANTAPVLAAVPDWSVLAGGTLVFTNAASDADLPMQSLTFSLDTGAPAGAAVHPVTGVFNYAAPATTTSFTNTVTVRVTDDGLPPLSDAKSFSIVVVAAPRIIAIVVDGGAVTITWESYAGRKYRLRSAASVDAAVWSDVGGEVTAGGPTASATDATGLGGQRFYRVLLVE